MFCYHNLFKISFLNKKKILNEYFKLESDSRIPFDDAGKSQVFHVLIISKWNHGFNELSPQKTRLIKIMFFQFTFLNSKFPV